MEQVILAALLVTMVITKVQPPQVATHLRLLAHTTKLERKLVKEALVSFMKVNLNINQCLILTAPSFQTLCSVALLFSFSHI